MSGNNQLRLTEDGSHTVFSPDFVENYHSSHGAVTESMHVFIKNGLDAVHLQSIRILEVGFGTGLNALLTIRELAGKPRQVYYHGVEAFPLEESVYKELNYTGLITGNYHDLFQTLHTCNWNTDNQLTDYFILHKTQGLLQDIPLKDPYNLVYYDVFSPEKQPGLWTTEVFLRIFNSLEPGAVLVTYCAKGQVRRNLLSAGFRTERLAGAPGKREMLRAIKE
ncbi:MAG: tRNA (5-methylaminomethyl-2-thiouridine)(34)-methyltransferase MnmD [Bacteroidales bacterium]